MAIALRGSTLGLFNASPTVVALPNTTNLNDCIVVCMALQGTPTVTITGGGATWVQALDEPPGPSLYIWVGYGCSAGNSTITITFSGGTGSYALGQFSGVVSASSPVASATGSTNGTSVSTLASPTAAATPGQLVVAALALSNAGTMSWSTTTWSNSQTTTSLGAETTAGYRQVAADFVIPTGGATLGATYAWSPATSNQETGILVLNPSATAAPFTSFAPLAGWQSVLNTLAGTSNLGENAAANRYAGTSNLGLLAALNAKAGTSNLGLDAVCNEIAGTTGLEALAALNRKAGS